MSQLIWTPGMAGPLEEFVKRVHRRIDVFREENATEEVAVSIELLDGSLHLLQSLTPEPGFGFVSFRPHVEDDDPQELIVPLGAIREIRIGVAEPPQRMGFVSASPDASE
jgi:hypothetical protein